MALTLNGSNNTIGGVAVGGLPDGIVDTDMLAANAVNLAKLGKTTGKYGPILQIVHANYASAVESSNTAAYTDTGLTASITPTSSTNTILVMISQNFRLASATNGGQNGGAIQILRGSTNITTNQQAYLFYNSNSQSASLFNYTNYSVQVLDSPSTTSATTYKTQQITYGTGTSIYANYSGVSRMTLLELAS